MQDLQPALAAAVADEELQSTVVPFSLDKRPEAKRLIYSGRCSARPCMSTVQDAHMLAECLRTCQKMQCWAFSFMACAWGLAAPSCCVLMLSLHVPGWG